jgi:hypothetical protein
MSDEPKAAAISHAGGAHRHDEGNVRHDTGTRCRHQGSNGRLGEHLRPRTFNLIERTGESGGDQQVA